jgi:3-deoxy-D-manno-octulosonic-acid transferase
MRIVYSVILYITAPLFILHLVVRGFRNPDYWRRWDERFGRYRTRGCRHSLWVHAVSVGEVQAALPLIQSLQQRFPDYPLVITTTTPTGSSHVQQLLGDEVIHVYAPYDMPHVVGQFLDHMAPALAIIMETEIWPNIFHQCHERGIPLVMANARMSERSARGYRRVRGFTRDTLGMPSMIAAQTQKDAERFIALGAAPDRVRVTGSVKIDARIPASLHEQAEVLRRQWGTERTVWIAASTHEGEEEKILDVYHSIAPDIPGLLLVIVPRHPERFSRVAALCRKHGLKVQLRSEQADCDANTQVVIGDSMGELPLYYAASDLAFIGGSLIRHGGQNLLEAAALGKAVIVGPHMFNFEEITAMMVEAEAAVQVHSVGELTPAVRRLLQDANLRHSVGHRGRQVVEDNRGAIDRLMVLIVEVMTTSG